MKPAGMSALITGGAGGIGGAIAAQLLARGAAVLLVGRDEAALDRAVLLHAAHGERIGAVVADLTLAADRQRVCETAVAWRGGVNVLVNNAGVNHFTMFADQPAAQIDLTLAVNIAAPLHLCRELLSHLVRQPEARILNIGSVFGTIGYPGCAVYSASKFALRGFTEALRRELVGASVRVQYLAPRATRTGFNSAAVERMNAELGVAMDLPERVARSACALLESGRAEAVIGWPEKLFARVNTALPHLVDRALRKQLPTIRRCATGAIPAVPPPPLASRPLSRS
jgi:short-subunit dehydrogenase